ncbi:MAG: hypothetical protein ACYDB7_09115, partial [Mycobacteriales bacterium]
QVTLPPGALQALVPAPAQAPTGLVPLLHETGPATLAKVASFSAHPTAAAAALARHGFVDAYQAVYADIGSGRILVVLVIRFRTPAGATADLAANTSVPLPAGAHQVVVAPVGDTDIAVAQPLPRSSTGELVTLRMRVGDLTFLIAVGARQPVDPGAVDTIAQALAEQAVQSGLASPSAASPPAAGPS